jgi:hypothetical protein
MSISQSEMEALRREWTDQYVQVNPDQVELRRFVKTFDGKDDLVGRVVTVNWNGKAVVDFQDGGWYDITASTEHLKKLDPEAGRAKYKNVNSAQPVPDKQG